MIYGYTHKRTVRAGSPVGLQAGEVAVEYDGTTDVYEQPTDRGRFGFWALEAWEEMHPCDLDGQWCGDVFSIE